MDMLLTVIATLILICAVWIPILFDWSGKFGTESNVWTFLWLVVYIPFLIWIWIKVVGLL